MNKTYIKSPVLPKALLRLLLKTSEYQEKSGDLEEAYLSLHQEMGAFRARLWYWLQVCKAAPVFIMNTLYWYCAMLKNYTKIMLRNLSKHKGFSFINLTGLTLGLTAFILIVLYVRFELSYDRFHENAENIYKVYT